jgi:hypothetical protein
MATSDLLRELDRAIADADTAVERADRELTKIDQTLQSSDRFWRDVQPTLRRLGVYYETGTA